MANSATVGILRALLIADTADFEQKLADATKDVGKLEAALTDVGSKTGGAMAPASEALNQASVAATNFTKSLLGLETTTGAVAGETAAVTEEVSSFAGVVEAFVGELAGPELGAMAAGFSGLVLPITLAAAALGGWLAWVYQWTDLGPAIDRLWASLTARVEDYWAAIADATTALGEFTTEFQDLIPGLTSAKVAVGALALAFDVWFEIETRKLRFFIDNLAVLQGMMGKPVVPEPETRLGESFLQPGALPAFDLAHMQQIQRELTQELREQTRERDAIRRKEAAAYEALVRGAYRLSTQQLIDDQQRLTREVELATKQFGSLSEQGIKQVITRSNEYLAAGLKLTPAIQNIRLAHVDLLAAMIPVTNNTKALLETTQSATAAFKAAGKELGPYSAQLEHFDNILGNAQQGMARIFDILKKSPGVSAKDLFPEVGNLLEQSLTGGALRFAQGLPQLLSNAFEGGGQSIGKQLGMAVADAIGTAMGPAIAKAIQSTGASKDLAAGIGIPIVGLFVTGFQIMFDSIGKARKAHEEYLQSAREMTADLHAQVVGPNGPYQDFQALEAAAKELGLTFEDVWNPDLVHTFGHHLQERIDEFKRLQKETEEWKRKVTGAIDELSAKLKDFGGTVPKSLQPMLAALLESKDLTKDMRSQLEGLAADPSWRTLQGIAEKYGIALSGLGASFQKARITDIALEYARDFQVLIDSGGDLTAIVEGAADELNALYRDAKKNGVALPETLRPYMQRLVDLGLLVDDDGKKITDLNGITFENIEDKLLTQVVDVLKEIAKLLAEGLPKAAEEGAEAIARAFSRNPITIPVQFGDPTWTGPAIPRTPPGPAPTIPGPVVPRIGMSGGTQGEFVDATTTSPTLSTDDYDSGPMNITVISQLDGKEVARNQVRYLPRTLQLAGL